MFVGKKIAHNRIWPNKIYQIKFSDTSHNLKNEHAFGDKCGRRGYAENCDNLHWIFKDSLGLYRVINSVSNEG